MDVCDQDIGDLDVCDLDVCDPDICDQDVCDPDVHDLDLCGQIFVSKTFVTILKTNICDQQLKTSIYALYM